MAFDAMPAAVARSDRAEVRNPVLGLPAAQALLAQPADVRAVLAALFYDLAADARTKGAESLKRNKPWMFVYWRVVATYARHVARALKTGGGR